MAKKQREPKELTDLQEAIEEIKQRFGEGAIMKLSEAKAMDVEVIPTGAISVDMALGVGGIPRGRIIEIYGPEATGKTSLALHIIAEAQKRGGVGAFIDAEHALDPDYARKIGVKIDDLLISQPDSGEQSLQILETLVRSGEVDVIVVDSVAALTPKNEIAGEMGEFQIGLQARLMSSALRKLSSIISKTKTSVIFLNQIRMKIGVMFGCFAYDAPVLLADGTRRKIGSIVNTRASVDVLSYNFDQGRIESKPVVDWHINGETKEFLQFFVQNHTGNGHRGFSCTPEHKIYTPHGWKKARELRVGDEIITKIDDIVLAPEQEEVIIGSLFGDGNIKKFNEQTAYSREEHGPKQARYVEWLGQELGDITSNVSLKTVRGNALLETRHLLRLGDFHSLFYPDRKKIIPEEIIENVTPRVLALWYCGDGSLQEGISAWKGKTYKRQPRAALYVNGFHDAESRECIMRIFTRFQLYPKWRQCGIDKVLGFSVSESAKFFEIIAPFVPDSMVYKLPITYRGQYQQQQRTTAQSSMKKILRPMKIKEIRKRIPYQDGARVSKRRFDVTVADNHNYFVDGCLVSNSPETTPGGLALKFYASVRIELRRAAQIKKGEEITGNRVRAKIVKNKVAPPFKTTEFDIYYNEGISAAADILNTGLKEGVVSKMGSWFQYGNQKLGQGSEQSKTFLQENPKIAKEIRERLLAQKG